MLKQRKKRLFVLIFILAFSISLVLFAFSSSDTAIVSISGAGGDYASISGIGGSWSKLVFGKELSKVEEVDLFSIIPKSTYTGDLIIQVSLVNTAELFGVYQYLRMEMELQDKEGNKIDKFQLISLTSRDTEFLLEYPGGGWDSPYKIKITGGSYLTKKGAAGNGESFSPRFYGEIMQR